MKSYRLSDISVETWVQGGPRDIEELVGSVVLVEVFQVNCPGCFLHALPKAIQLYQQYANNDLVIIGLATAFEDYDKNTLDNLKKLVKTGEVIGETLKALTHQGFLTDDKLDWRLPFTVGMDRVVPETEPITQEKIMDVTKKAVPNFELLPEHKKQMVLNQVNSYLQQKTMKAETFERFALQGTPSAILFDRQGDVRDVSFGQQEHLPVLIEQYLATDQQSS